ncbi:hypothetical protein PENSPDRAFT_648841 [Peniophora sp. CONT]|nr:hypothetical protein PENSPDRAFT_648841 [Peniophora sp. CONT]
MASTPMIALFKCAFALQRGPCLHQSELIGQRVSKRREVPTLTPVLSTPTVIPTDRPSGTNVRGSKTPAISHGLIRETKTHYYRSGNTNCTTR